MMPNPKQTIALRDLNSACSNIPSDTAATVRQVKTALRILRIRQLVERTGLSRATLYKLMAADPKFPKRVRLTPGTVGFLEAEVDAWIAARAELRTAVQYGDGHADYR